MGRTIGIDLGTTNTVMAWVGTDKRPEVIITRDHERGLPSAVTRYRDNFLVGQAARNVARGNPANYVFSIKRLMGRRLSDPEVERVSRHVPYRIVAPPDDPDSDDVRVLIGNLAYSPVQISAEILRRAKADAELYFNEPVTHAVITVPAYFDDNQKASTREAGRLAGLKVRKILDEPSAAALAFGLSLDVDDERAIVVYDMGGGTFDISVISISNGISIVEAVKGDMWLGGNVFDEEIMECVLEHAESEEPGSRARLQLDPFFMWQLREQAEQAKKTMGNPNIASADIVIPGTLNGSLDIDMVLRLAEFERRIRRHVVHSVDLMTEAMAKAGMKPDDITDVLLVGGSTAVPLVRRLLSELFGDTKIRANVNPMECVALGAALQAQMIPFILCDCGRANDDDATCCANCGTPLGAVAPSLICPNCGVPNELDALLCANPQCSRALSMDAPVGNPYGIGLDDDRYKIIIPVGTRYPMADPIYEKFYTIQNDQSFIAIPVYQGEHMGRASKNAWQGQITLTIPEDRRGPAGLPIRVGMGIDKDGVLTVSVAGEGPLQGVHIAVQVDRSQKASVCPKCGRRNPQEARQCAVCTADLVQTGQPQNRVCSRCNNAYKHDSPACPHCGFRPPREAENFKRALQFQLVLARIGSAELDWLMPRDLLAPLRPLIVQAEYVAEHGDREQCDATTQQLLATWEQTLFHDLAFCTLLARSDAGTVQQRQEIAALFDTLETAVRQGEDARSREAVDRILAMARQITAALDNATCPHCFQSTPRGAKCAHCSKSLRDSGGITDEGAHALRPGSPAGAATERR
jgi:molecular chaperone DnaK (HSP70)